MITLPSPAPVITACDREPIRIPGAIQPHGVLLVVDPRTGIVLQASANAVELLRLGASPVESSLAALSPQLPPVFEDGRIHHWVGGSPDRGS